MSLLKPFNKRRTRMTVQPIRAQTSSSPAEVRLVVEDLVAADRERTQLKYGAKAAAKPKALWGVESYAAGAYKQHLHVNPTAGGYHLSYPYDHNSRNSWDAEILISGDDAGSVVTCQVLRWLEKDGELDGARIYLRFVNELGAAIGPKNT